MLKNAGCQPQVTVSLLAIVGPGPMSSQTRSQLEFEMRPGPAD